jgi:hypothetical protein
MSTVEAGEFPTLADFISYLIKYKNPPEKWVTMNATIEGRKVALKLWRYSCQSWSISRINLPDVMVRCNDAGPSDAKRQQLTDWFTASFTHYKSTY